MPVRLVFLIYSVIPKNVSNFGICKWWSIHILSYHFVNDTFDNIIFERQLLN